MCTLVCVSERTPHTGWSGVANGVTVTTAATTGST
jgi:hypothetical protein